MLVFLFIYIFPFFLSSPLFLLCGGLWCIVSGGAYHGFVSLLFCSNQSALFSLNFENCKHLKLHKLKKEQVLKTAAASSVSQAKRCRFTCPVVQILSQYEDPNHLLVFNQHKWLGIYGWSFERILPESLVSTTFTHTIENFPDSC